MKNYYSVLEVPRDADQAQIRRAFRRLSKQYHPDRHGGERRYEERFKEINEAYQALKDPVRRWQYREQCRRRSSSSRTNEKWSPPHFSSRQTYQKYERKAHRRPPYYQPDSGEQSMGFKGFFWSAMIILVFITPFFMANSTDAQPASRQWVQYEPVDLVQEVTLGLKGSLDARLKKDIYYLKQIRKIDPELRRLNLETGYYELDGHMVKLSWEILKLIREKRWKLQ